MVHTENIVWGRGGRGLMFFGFASVCERPFLIEDLANFVKPTRLNRA